MVTRLIQINGGRSILAMHELRRYLNSGEVQVLHVQEPYARLDTRWSGCTIYHGAQAKQQIWALTVIKDQKLNTVMNTQLSNQ